MYGWRARIGQLVPSVNTCLEVEMQRMAPEGVAFYAHRLKLARGGEEELLAMADRVEEGASLLADAKVDLILFNCTAGSLIGGVGYDQKIIQRIEAATGLPATTTATGVMAAFRRLGIGRLVMVSPYVEFINQKEVAYLEAMGLEVLRYQGLSLDDGFAFMAVNPGDWYRMVKENQVREADGYFISCVNVRSADAINDLERDLGKPVVTSLQAALWHCLDKVGVKVSIPGFGTLLRDCLA